MTKKQPVSDGDVTRVMRRLRRKNIDAQKARLKRASTKRLATQAGALMIKDDAVDLVRQIMERATADLVASSVRLARAGGRRTLIRRDLKTVLDMRGITIAGDYGQVGRVCLPKPSGSRPSAPAPTA